MSYDPSNPPAQQYGGPPAGPTSAVVGTDPATGEPVTSDQRLWAFLSPLLALVVSVIPAIVVYFTVGKRSAFARSHAANVINIQITVAIASIVLGGVAAVLFAIGAGNEQPVLLILAIIVYLVLIVYGIALFVFEIIATVRAYGVKRYRAPLTLHLVK